jgi:hypothetical protein
MKKTVRVGAGSGFWGDNLEPAIEIAKNGNVQYLAYDFLGEPTIPILQKLRQQTLMRASSQRFGLSFEECFRSA